MDVDSPPVKLEAVEVVAPRPVTVDRVSASDDNLLLNVVQSAALKAPLFRAEAVGTFKVITGVVVPVATVLVISVPVVPIVIADTDVTVPEPLLLNVFQSAALKAPLFRPEAVGTFKVITGVVVPVATVLDKSVPVVPKVRADTDVTVPPGFEELIVTFGHIPDTVTLVPAVIAAVVEPVPPLSIGSVPVTPVVNGRPVRLVATPDAGVPSAGPVNVGLVNVNPVIVAAVPPSEIDVEPTVTELYVNAAFGIAVNPVPIDPEVKAPTVVNDDVTTALLSVVPVNVPAAAVTVPLPPKLILVPLTVKELLVKYALAIVEPCQTPVPMVPTVVSDDVTTVLFSVVPVIPLAATEPAEPVVF